MITTLLPLCKYSTLLQTSHIYKRKFEKRKKRNSQLEKANQRKKTKKNLKSKRKESLISRIKTKERKNNTKIIRLRMLIFLTTTKSHSSAPHTQDQDYTPKISTSIAILCTLRTQLSFKSLSQGQSTQQSASSPVNAVSFHSKSFTSLFSPSYFSSQSRR